MVLSIGSKGARTGFLILISQLTLLSLTLVPFSIGHLASPTSPGDEMDEDFEAPSRNQSHEDQHNYQPEYMDEEPSERVTLKRFASTGTLRNQSRASAVSFPLFGFSIYLFLYMDGTSHYMNQCRNIHGDFLYYCFYVARSQCIHIHDPATIGRETTSPQHYRPGPVKMTPMVAVSSSPLEVRTSHHHPQYCKTESLPLELLPPSVPTLPQAATQPEDPFLLLHATSEPMVWFRPPFRLSLQSLLRLPLLLQLQPLCLPPRLSLESRRSISRRLPRLRRGYRPSMAISARAILGGVLRFRRTFIWSSLSRCTWIGPVLL